MTIKKNLIMILLMSIIASTAQADQISDANKVIDECTKTVDSGNKVIDLKTREIGAQNDLIALQNTQIKDLSRDKGSIFSNPWLYFTLGLVTGVIIIKK